MLALPWPLTAKVMAVVCDKHRLVKVEKGVEFLGGKT